MPRGIPFSVLYSFHTGLKGLDIQFRKCVLDIFPDDMRPVNFRQPHAFDNRAQKSDRSHVVL